MNLSVIRCFFWTAWYGLKIAKRENDNRRLIKRYWSEKILKNLGFQLTVKGNPPKRGACILVGNHISFLDIPVLLSALPTCTFISKDDLLKWPIIGPSAAAAGTLFISRSSGSDRTAVRNQISQYFQNTPDAKLVVFPSGTTSLDESHSWKKGIFEIAQQLEIPVQTFSLSYIPLRASAYIDDDSLIGQMYQLVTIPNKKVNLSWLKLHPRLVGDPLVIAQEIRASIII
ncbi:MAG: 1-acyl-sn-glycerol-3-phosphate acyltransferase [Xanthomonadaceae bacterium]|nr:1-acyl-sn-glycerol-3-phosphate acyltransferase [Xanthomonadaceae bacterium]